MITSKNGYVGTMKCVKYSGTHEELRDMLKEGDIVTLLWQNDDKSESIKITGTVTVTSHDLSSVIVRTLDDEEEYILDYPNLIAVRKYTVASIKRPIENIMPDAPGPWSDRFGDTWIVDDDLDAIHVSDEETWVISGCVLHPYEYAARAPFKKIDINIIKEED